MFKSIQIFILFAILAFSNPVLAKKNIVQPKKNNQINFTFIGCSGEEKAFSEIAALLNSSEQAWNKHQLENLISFYAPNFESKDGINIEKIRSNLTEFWQTYSNAQINSMPGTIYVCGNYSVATLTEITTATGTIEDSKFLAYPPQFKAVIRGMTTLKKNGDNWKIISEEILSEEMWKYYGPIAEKLLNEGKIKLIIPNPIKQDENYIAKLQYSLPEKVQAVALIDKILLTEFPENNLDKNKKIDESKKKEKEIESARRTIEGESSEGLRRLFTSNSFGQDELVRAQIELVSFDGKGPSLAGIIGLSQRIIPKKTPAPDQAELKKTIIKTLKEESQ